MARTQPNIIVTGTPGVGKTTHCEMLAERTGLRHVAINQIVKDKECHEGWDEEFGCWIVDEDKVGNVCGVPSSIPRQLVLYCHAYPVYLAL